MPTITQPTSGQSFPSPANVTVSGTGGPLASWILFKGTTQVQTGGVVQGRTWNFTLNNLGPGSYTIQVTDEKGGTASVDFTVT